MYVPQNPTVPILPGSCPALGQGTQGNLLA
jgi:hypothetical protein